MDDQQLWDCGTERLKEVVARLSAGTMQELNELLAGYRQTKGSLATVIAEVDAASVCRECGGQCCLNGKYRITVLDAVAHMRAEILVSADFSKKPLCPYSSDAGCSMAPGLRPADCILFICDAIDQKLSPQARNILAEQEIALRDCISKASRLIGVQFKTPLLLWAAGSVT